MNRKEPINLYRLLSVVVIVLTTLGITAALCSKSHLYLDEWLCILFLDVTFILIYIFELEYERRNKGICSNAQTNFIRLAVVYAICCILAFGMTFLPEFFRPVMLIPILICSVSNAAMALAVGLFFNILLALASGGGFYALAGYTMMTLLGAVLSQALKEKRYRAWLAFLFLFLNVFIPDVLYYLSYKEISGKALIYGIGNGVVTALSAYFVFGWIWLGADRECDDQMLDIISEDYSEVKALKDFSIVEYRHANKVSDIAFRCAKQVGCNANLCLAAGFYYRMGQWLGEPYVQNGVDKAFSLCFPTELISILAEYYGLEELPTTPESALVHMVDALVIKIEAMGQEVEKSKWNSDILIYQTLNEFSASGMYDRSGMSMNQFLKVREFLAKEEMLR